MTDSLQSYHLNIPPKCIFFLNVHYDFILEFYDFSTTNPGTDTARLWQQSCAFLDPTPRSCRSDALYGDDVCRQKLTAIVLPPLKTKYKCNCNYLIILHSLLLKTAGIPHKTSRISWLYTISPLAVFVSMISRAHVRDYIQHASGLCEDSELATGVDYLLERSIRIGMNGMSFGNLSHSDLDFANDVCLMTMWGKNTSWEPFCNNFVKCASTVIILSLLETRKMCKCSFYIGHHN